ncbi:MAG TPA: SRPBCC family protein [Jatrophihabitantaceae bacterium]|nr:SRPBCC family protein [Jatrophihabitantaceae bacterium]
MTQGTTSFTAVITLPKPNQILITREFAAPAANVFRAITTPELISQWWSGDRGTVTHVDVDLRVGGAWRNVMLAHDEFEVAFHGEYRELVPNERIVSTEVYEGVPDETALNTITLTEHDGRTTMSVLCEYSSEQVRDAVIESGMEGGMQEAYNHLEQVAAALS